jgi:hypothetical protein
LKSTYFFTVIFLLLATTCRAQNPIFEKYIGKEYRSLSEFEAFSEYKDYGGMLIGTDSTGRQFAVEHYKSDAGQIVTFETVRTENHKASYTLLDGIVIDDLDSNQYVMSGQCEFDGEYDSYLVVVYEQDEQDVEYFTNILKAWRANPKTNRFDAVDPTKIKCINEGYDMY